MPDDVPVRVLIIEDEPDMNDLLADILSAYGFEPVQANSGEQGLARVAEQPPDAILLDLMLPGLSGFELCQHLKGARATRRIPILILTALDSHRDRHNAYMAGADDYVTKPFAPDALVSRLRACLEESRQAADPNRCLEAVIEPTGGLADLKAFNRLATCLFFETDLALEQIEAVRKGLIRISAAAGQWANDRDGLPPVRLSMHLAGRHLRLLFEPEAEGGDAFLAEHLAPKAAIPAALIRTGVIDRVATTDGGVTLEKILPRPEGLAIRKESP